MDFFTAKLPATIAFWGDRTLESLNSENVIGQLVLCPLIEVGRP